MPDTVEASGDTGDGGEEGVAHPDGKDGILLSETLGHGYPVSVMRPHPPAYSKLQKACHK